MAWFPRVFVVGWLAVAAGCSGTEMMAGALAPCDAAAPCDAGLTCLEGFCRDLAAPCEADLECLHGYLCVRGACAIAEASARTSFVDVAPAVGLGQTPRDTARPEHNIAASAAFLDLSGDGLTDVFAAGGFGRYYLGQADGTFREVTHDTEGGAWLPAWVTESGMDGLMSCADYDNDGDIDIVMSSLGRTALLRNRGDGRFEDVTEESGLLPATPIGGVPPGKRLHLAMQWIDLDADGWLDIFRGYLEETPDDTGPPDPGDLPAEVLRSRGDGTFERWPDTGLEHRGNILAAVFADFDDDGDIDGLLGNDFDRNYLYVNEGGRWRERSLEFGVGHISSPMGFAVGDPDEDGDLDIILSNNGASVYYVAEEPGSFIDASLLGGVQLHTEPSIGWGVLFRDLDLDGHDDFIQANGSVEYPSLDDLQVTGGVGRDGATLGTAILFGLGDGRFIDAPRARNDLPLDHTMISRPLASADYDHDGDLDLLIGNAGPYDVDFRLQLLRNDLPVDRDWVAFRLQGTRASRTPIGASVRVRTGDRWRRQVLLHGAGESIASCSEPELWFALPDGDAIEEVEVTWPGGRATSHSPPAETRKVALIVEPE